MGWPVCNSTLENERIDEIPLWEGGLTFHKLSILVSGGFAVAAACVSFALIMCHATHYSKPIEQRHIIRILFMVPVYSAVSWLGIVFYRHSIYYSLIGSCYEAFAIAAFFALMCHYIAPDLRAQKDYFRGITPKAWVWPMGWFQKCTGGKTGLLRTPRSGLTWFNVIWVGVFQYCFFRVLMTVVAVVTQSFDDYCEESLNPAFAHVWVLGIEAAAVSIAMYCLIQFYIQIRLDIQQFSPFLKILSIKLVIFLSFWQTTVISFLFSAHIIKPSTTIQTQDLKVGVPNLLICIEMALFSILHLWAFKWQPYSLRYSNEVTDFYGNGKATYQGGPMGIKALLDASNPVDLLKAVGRSFKWLFVGHKTRMLDPSYQKTQVTDGLPSSDVVPMKSMPEPHTTAYGGAGAALTGGRSDRYGSVPDEEGENLLAHAQSNPTAYPVHSASSEPEPLGVAVTSYDEEPRGRRHHYGSVDSDTTTSEPGMRTPQPTPPSPYGHLSPDHSFYRHPTEVASPPRAITPVQEAGTPTGTGTGTGSRTRTRYYPPQYSQPYPPQQQQQQQQPAPRDPSQEEYYYPQSRI